MLCLDSSSFYNFLKWQIDLEFFLILFTIYFLREGGCLDCVPIFTIFFHYLLGEGGPNGNSAKFIIFTVYFFESFPLYYPFLDLFMSVDYPSLAIKGAISRLVKVN